MQRPVSRGRRVDRWITVVGDFEVLVVREGWNAPFRPCRLWRRLPLRERWGTRPRGDGKEVAMKTPLTRKKVDQLPLAEMDPEAFAKSPHTRGFFLDAKFNGEDV